MRSLIILEVEHGEDTDFVQNLAEELYLDYEGITNYAVRVDLPECFRLES